MRLIDADALKKEFCKDIMGGLNWESIIDNAPSVHDTINLYPSGEVIIQKTRPQGKWVVEHDWVHCFPCGHEQNYPSNFCPNCGAKMEAGTRWKEEEDEE